ncbi:hypothetical protein [Pontibaca methylaminivorans]|uniref:hypothetical protein n=1 Tax=Pontibaca methylaminivorans TaxID=515897 RepID=UPI00097643D6|nr:hypothetical protein [Pontibaca methylaminivorans]
MAHRERFENTPREPEQLEAALDHLFRPLCFAVENPGAIAPAEMDDWLRMAAAERDRQGDYGAARMLDALAVQADDND